MRAVRLANPESITIAEHGFRYIEVHGLAAAPSLDDFTALEMHTAVAETGSFTSSSPLLNQIQSNCQWTARSNLMSIPTDCCQRDERRGWMGAQDVAVRFGVRVSLA